VSCPKITGHVILRAVLPGCRLQTSVIEGLRPCRVLKVLRDQRTFNFGRGTTFIFGESQALVPTETKSTLLTHRSFLLLALYMGRVCMDDV
jgi:hypothetical protein